MEKTQLTLELITPMFLNAARSSGPPVLRAAPFRGVLRYWLRALAQYNLSDPINITDLKEYEGSIFGNTQLGSLISLDVFNNADRPLQINNQINILPHRNALPSPGFLNGGRFVLGIQGRVGLSLSEDCLKTLLLWLNLGGVGKRARRGFGSLQCVGIEPDSPIPDSMKSYFRTNLPTDGAQLADHIYSILSYCIGGGTSGSIQRCANATLFPAANYFSKAPYPGFRKGRWIIVVGRGNFRTYENAMIDLFNNRLGMNRGNHAFGSENPRFASPVHVHIARSEKGYHTVFTAFYADPTTPDEWTMIHALLANCLEIYNDEALYL